MRILKAVFVFLVIVAVGSCKKEPYPVSSTGEQVFYMDATINGTPVHLKAGEDNYYMHSYYHLSLDSVYNFIGILGQEDSTNFTNSIEIQVNDNKYSTPSSPIIIDEALKAGNYNYYAGLYSLAYSAQFNSLVTDSALLSWDFGDGGSSNAPNPVHIYSNPGIYQVCLSIENGGSCFSNICNVISLLDTTSPFRVSLSTQALTNNWVSFSPQVTGGTWPYDFYWDFGDGTTSDIDTGVTKHYAASDLYQVTLRVIDAHGDTAITGINAPTEGYANCVANFDLIDVNSMLVFNNGLSNVIIKWTDNSGKVFVSNNDISQPAASYFKIISQEPYKNNERGEVTRKLHIKFSCALYNGSESIWVNDGDAVIAVAYK